LEESEWAQPGHVPTQVGQNDEVPGVPWSQDGFPNTCPGKVVRLPLITDAYKAHRAFDKGCLESFYPDLTHELAEAVLEVSAGCDEYTRQHNAAQVRKIKEQ
jgi:hypothetical protein